MGDQENNQKPEKEMDNKSIYSKKVIVGTRVIAVMRNKGIRYGQTVGGVFEKFDEPKPYDSLKLKDTESGNEVKLNQDVLNAINEAIAVKA